MSRRRAVVAGFAVLVVGGLGAGCAAGAQQNGATAADPGARSVAPGPESAPESAAESDADPPRAREGSVAASQRVTFVPQSVTVPGGASAEVLPAATVRGELVVPENVRHVGWWDGSAAAGDPFGTTVVAGHVDSASEGLGYFARLLSLTAGERVTLGSGRHRLDYRITSVETVTKQTLATSAAIFDQTGPHRLVLITCTGAYRPGRGYDSNLVVTARPLGPAR